MSKPSTVRKPLGYWVITLLMLAVMGIVTWMTVLALLAGDIAQFALGVLLLMYMVLNIIQPKWYIRATAWVSDARNL